MPSVASTRGFSHVSSPTMPSTVSDAHVWKALTALSV